MIDRSHLLWLTLPVADGALDAVRDAVGALDGLSPEARHDLGLVAGELVTNVVEHAARPARQDITVTVVESETSLLLEVGDTGSGFSVDQVTQARQEPDARGLGLFIVEQFSERWGVKREGGFTVWAEIRKR